MRITFKMMFNTVITMPSRKGVRASPAARKAPLNMKNISMPKLNTNMIRMYGSASTWNLRSRIHNPEQPRRQEVTQRRHDPHGQEHRRQKGLVDAAVHLVGLARAGKPGDQHAHAGEDRADENNDDDEDLETDSDGGVAGGADELANHDVVHDSPETLQ